MNSFGTVGEMLPERSLSGDRAVHADQIPKQIDFRSNCGVDVLRLPVKIRVKRTDNDSGMFRAITMQPDEMFAV